MLYAYGFALALSSVPAVMLWAEFLRVCPPKKPSKILQIKKGRVVQGDARDFITATFPLGFHVYGTSFAPNSNTTTMLCTAEFLPAPVPQILGLGHAGQHLGLSWWQFLVFFASMFAQWVLFSRPLPARSFATGVGLCTADALAENDQSRL